MFDLNRWYNRWYNRRYNWPIVQPIHIKPVHSCLSYQQAIYEKYDRRGRQSPSGYGPRRPVHTETIMKGLS